MIGRAKDLEAGGDRRARARGPSPRRHTVDDRRHDDAARGPVRDRGIDVGGDLEAMTVVLLMRGSARRQICFRLPVRPHEVHRDPTRVVARDILGIPEVRLESLDPVRGARRIRRPARAVGAIVRHARVAVGPRVGRQIRGMATGEHET